MQSLQEVCVKRVVLGEMLEEVCGVLEGLSAIGLLGDVCLGGCFLKVVLLARARLGPLRSVQRNQSYIYQPSPPSTHI